jgi:hypothetical protein
VVSLCQPAQSHESERRIDWRAHDRVAFGFLRLCVTGRDSGRRSGRAYTAKARGGFRRGHSLHNDKVRRAPRWIHWTGQIQAGRAGRLRWSLGCMLASGARYRAAALPPPRNGTISLQREAMTHTPTHTHTHTRTGGPRQFGLRGGSWLLATGYWQLLATGSTTGYWELPLGAMWHGALGDEA